MRPPHPPPPRLLATAFILFHLLSPSLSLRLLVISNDDIVDSPADTNNNPPSSSDDDSAADWDEFGDPDASVSDEDYDPGSWRPIFESLSINASSDDQDSLYSSGVRGMVAAASSGDASEVEDAAAEIEAAAAGGHPHAQSALGFLYGAGISRTQSLSKSVLYHHFAAEGGNMQSKMVLAYTYFRQDVSILSSTHLLVVFTINLLSKIKNPPWKDTKISQYLMIVKLILQVDAEFCIEATKEEEES